MTDHLLAELLQPDRLRATLSSLWTLRAEKAVQVDGREAALRGELARTEEKLKRLYRMVEKGATDLDDIPKGRLQALKQERDRARAALAAEIAPKLIERFGPLMRTTVTRGEIPFRKAWLQAIVDRAEVEADAILGHRDPKTTQRYAHLARDPVRAAADQVSGIIASALATPALASSGAAARDVVSPPVARQKRMGRQAMEPVAGRRGTRSG
ncbi:hypothetical protein [Methylobacterium mesophilicum]|uniref:hypothetical protein n=1 Tax=Methylobacterium mesophilicum TaxID=39956 RepID=UPI0002C60523|nr:hypothetical protein [Methylobacterium mesophilicum]